MDFELRHFDVPLLRFRATEDSSIPEIEILWCNEQQKHLLPLDLQVTGNGIANWLKQRVLPKNRAYSHTLLSKCGMNINRPMNIVQASKGLSLNDCYWIVEVGFEGTFEKYNLYDNRFSRVLAKTSLTGYGNSIHTGFDSCPEFTTNGMLPKCWRRKNGIIKLYKGGTSSRENNGNEPYSEYYAAQIANTLGIHAIDYNLSKWNGVLCSTCKLFTTKDFSFLPVGRIVTTGSIEDVSEYYETLGPEFVNALRDMVVFDALVCNTDRHFGNFGFLVDNHTNKIAAPAPLFDHGHSVFSYASEQNMESEESLNLYAESLMPRTYDDFIGTARSVLTSEHREKICRLLDFKFKRHPRYNLPKRRLRLIEKQIQQRVKVLLNK